LKRGKNETVKIYNPGLDRLGLLTLRDPVWAVTHTMGTTTLLNLVSLSTNFLGCLLRLKTGSNEVTNKH